MAKAMPMKPMKAVTETYSPEMDMHTLMEAYKIECDPKRHAAAKAHAKSKMSSMHAIAEGKEKMPDKESAAEDRAEIKAMKRY